MKQGKVYIFGVAKFSDGTTKQSRDFRNYSAFSNWANAQFRKDENVTVEEYTFTWGVWDFKLTSTWHA